MLSHLCETDFRWRRVAIFRPVRVTAGVSAKDAASQRQSVIAKCFPGMRVLLRREPTVHDRNAVSLFVSGGCRIGALPTEIAEWVAPLLDSGKAAFDAEIWSLGESECEHDHHQRICRLILTQYERVPIKRLSFSAWWSGDGRSCTESPFRDRQSNRGWALSPSIHLFSTSAGILTRSGRHANRAADQHETSEG
jgi:hypothetical protein